MAMELFLQQVASGVVSGSIYALIALGYVIIYKATDVVNFAQGDLMMAGAYSGIVAYSLLGLPFGVALAAAVAVGTILGLAVGGTVSTMLVRFKSSLVNTIILTLSIGIVLNSLAMLIFGPNPYPLPTSFGKEPIIVGGIRITPLSLMIIAFSAVVMAALFAFFRYTWVGKAMRATAQNRDAASLMGIDVGRMFALSWTLGSVLGALGGVLLAPLIHAEPSMGIVAVKAFAAAIIGGFTSLPGAIVGGLLLGILENLAGGYLSMAFKDGIAYLVLGAILLVKPTGFFERQAVRRV
ncbi:MAG: branched-chain amino acid ABC transporter permease [Candidatus Rokubacteria bacterium]|nr:branched-chain amino acid ABC transporter permease [Candidatus Rokubacteria bacterium]